MIVLLSADNNYIQHTGVTIRSILSNASKPELLNIKLLSDNISGENLGRLRESLFDFEPHLNLEVIDVNHYPVQTFNPQSNLLSKATYHRIYAGQFLKEYSGRVVYLDSDVIVRQDICELFTLDIGDHTIGAVQNEGLYHQKKLGMPVNKVFFNSGVLIIDLKKWRDRDVLPKLEQFISENNSKLRFADQDALNAVLHDDWFAIDPKWNMHLYFFQAPQKCNTDQKKLMEAIRDPAIVHFTTNEKPWYYMTSHPFKSEYFKYLKKTDWAGYNPPDRTFRNFIMKFKFKLYEESQNNFEPVINKVRVVMPQTFKNLYKQLKIG